MVMPWHIYQEAEEDGVRVHFMQFEEQPSMSVPGHIGIDATRLQTTAEETTAAAHELCHICTGSFYNIYSPVDDRQRCENDSDRYAIHRYIDKDELFSAINNGQGEYWQLSERFGFTEAFMRKAVCLYACGNLAVDYYCP